MTTEGSTTQSKTDPYHISFNKIPANEDEYSVWRFKTVNAVRAKLGTFKKAATENSAIVTKYMAAIEAGRVMNIPEQLETYDANIAVALLQPL